MLVSDSHKLVFVHVQKTGGLTVTRLLRRNVSDLHVVGARHGFAVEGMKGSEDWAEFFKFAFVRNPWDRLISWYSMVESMQETRHKKQNNMWHYVHDNSSTFEEFIRNCTDEVNMKRGVNYSFAYNQIDYLTDRKGRLLVDFIGRFENFEKDLREAFDRIDIKLETIPRGNRSAHKHYSTYYTPETELLVRDRFKRDIEYFGYEFERPHANQDVDVTEELSASRKRANTAVEVAEVAEPKAPRPGSME